MARFNLRGSRIHSYNFLMTAFFLLALGSYGVAEPNNYTVTIQPKDGGIISGYAQLDIHNDGSVAGKMCVYEPVRFPGFRNFNITERADNQPIGVIEVDGRKENSNLLRLRLQPSKEVVQSRLGGLFPSHFVEFSPLTSRDIVEPYLNSPFHTGKGWHTSAFDEIGARPKSRGGLPRLRMSFEVLPDDPRREILEGGITKHAGSATENSDSATLVKMTPDEALTYLARHPIKDEIETGFVWVVYNPDNRDELSRLIASIPGSRLSKTPQLSCGVPYVEDGITVTPLLEYYAAYKLQLSGLVFYAEPDSVPLNSGTIELKTEGTEIGTILKNSSLRIDQKSSMLNSFFDKRFMVSCEQSVLNSRIRIGNLPQSRLGFLSCIALEWLGQQSADVKVPAGKSSSLK